MPFNGEGCNPSVRILKDALEKIFEHAVREYPDECCGIITFKAANCNDANHADADNKNANRNDATHTVHACRNVQNVLHAQDAQRYPRDARTAYTIDRAQADAIFAAARRDSEEILAFYHSHPDHDAYFSDEDKAVQSVFGEPEFPDALHVVVSVRMGTINGVKCFKWDGKGDFVEVE
jgi:proteasome lid subunit RPN8/RPN11